MQAHSKRNSKTALMVSISFAFIIFGGSGAQLNTQLLTDVLAKLLGSDMTIWSLPIDDVGLEEYKMRKFLTEFSEDNPGWI